MYDPQLQTRPYFIDEILSVYEGERELRKVEGFFGICLSTIENGRRLGWIEIYIIKKGNKYYIDHFQITSNFPRPPNEIF